MAITKNDKLRKAYFNTIKELSKKYSWNFKSYFIFKVVDDFYFVVNFYVLPKTGNIHGYLAFKPFCLDDLFWEITNLKENSKLPLSFRGEAAFQVFADSIYDFNVIIHNEDELESEIEKILSEIEVEIQKAKNKFPNVESFLERQYKSDNIHSVRILTSLIKLEKYEEAINKIIEFRNKNIESNYHFGKKDFYNLVQVYCNKKLKKYELLIKRFF